MLEKITKHQVSCLLGIPENLNIAKCYDSQLGQDAKMLSLGYLFDVCPMQSWDALLNDHVYQAEIQANQQARWFSTSSYYQIIKLAAFSQTLDIEKHPLWLKNIKHIQYIKKTYSKISLKYSVPGPLSYLWFNDYLGKSKTLTVDKIEFLPKLIYQYKAIFQMLKAHNIDWIQLEDPVFITDILPEFQKNIIQAYQDLLTDAPLVMLATYFGGIEENLNWLKTIPFQGVHIDLEAAPEQIMFILKNEMMKTLKVLSLGGIRQNDSYFGAIQGYMASFIKFKPEIWIGFSPHLPVKKSNMAPVVHEKMIDIVKIYIESNFDCPGNFPKILALKNYVTDLKNQHPNIKISMDSLEELISFMKKRDQLNFIQHVESLAILP